MYVLGICGSPRTGGNTDILLSKVLEGAKQSGAKVEKITLNKLEFSPCQECENLRDDGTCLVRDDMDAVYKKVEEADVLILASPIFFGSLSAQTKMMIDRFQCQWRAKFLLKREGKTKRRKGFFICVEASHRKDFFNNAKSIVKNLFATVGATYSHELFAEGIDEKGSILNHPDKLELAFQIGERIVAE